MELDRNEIPQHKRTRNIMATPITNLLQGYTRFARAAAMFGRGFPFRTPVKCTKRYFAKQNISRGKFGIWKGNAQGNGAKVWNLYVIWDKNGTASFFHDLTIFLLTIIGPSLLEFAPVASRVQKPGKKFGLKTPFLDTLNIGCLKIGFMAKIIGPGFGPACRISLASIQDGAPECENYFSLPMDAAEQIIISRLFEAGDG